MAPAATAAAVPDFPYPVDPDDHCETPLEAYRDIAPLLSQLAGTINPNNKQQQLRIYDPYYCNGAVVQHLQTLGFPNVYNRKEDCYARWNNSNNNNSLLVYDVLVSNPPYSGNHIERLIRYLTCPLSSNQSRDRPWFLLLPQWVHKKDYYVRAMAQHRITPFYLVPRHGRRYVYRPPPQFRSKRASDVHQQTAPFVSLWYCWGGSPARNEQLVQFFYQQQNSSCDLARSKSALRDLRRRNKKNK